ncbi:hypothetical protein [Streptomyces sp. NPDC001933]|uniref:hypothetical protein n=1 Tax=Streptomyces sp. NPDC001933 TaxID=3364626 RepID=UPI0036C8BE39
MTSSGSQATENPHPELPHFQELLDETDWASLATPYGTGESLPTALIRLLEPNPSIRAPAAEDTLGAVTHQNTIYEATVPVALYVAAILNHPITAAANTPTRPTSNCATPPARRYWTGSAAPPTTPMTSASPWANAISVKAFLDACPDMRAFRDLRPLIYSAVQSFLTDDNAKVRDAALVAAIPLAEHHALTEHRNELADHARRLLSTSTDRYKRDRALDALNAWGQDTSPLGNAKDTAARESHARMADHNLWWASNETGGCAEDPPF